MLIKVQCPALLPDAMKTLSIGSMNERRQIVRTIEREHPLLTYGHYCYHQKRVSIKGMFRVGIGGEAQEFTGADEGFQGCKDSLSDRRSG